MRVVNLIAINLALWSGLSQMVERSNAHYTDGDRAQLTQLVKFVLKKKGH